jgi:transcription antitermination factor NusG
MNTEKKWFALYTKPRSEFKAEKDISALGIINYLPVVTKIKQWSDRKKKIAEPVLKSYIFINGDEKERLAALETNSVVRCLFENGKPAVIYDWQIENLKRFLDEKAEYFINNGLAKGTKIIIKSPPFEGVIGVIISEQNRKALTVNIDLLNRSISAVIPSDIEFEILAE